MKLHRWVHFVTETFQCALYSVRPPVCLSVHLLSVRDKLYTRNVLHSHFPKQMNTDKISKLGSLSEVKLR